MGVSITVYVNSHSTNKSSDNIAPPSTYPHILTLESEMWEGLNEICQREQSSLDTVCTAVYMTMAKGQTLERGVRYFILDYFRSAATDEGHIKAGHGLDSAFNGNSIH